MGQTPTPDFTATYYCSVIREGESTTAHTQTGRRQLDALFNTPSRQTRSGAVDTSVEKKRPLRYSGNDSCVQQDGDYAAKVFPVDGRPALVLRTDSGTQRSSHSSLI